MVDINNWIKRADDVLSQSVSAVTGSEKIAFATSMLTAFYGPESTQMKVFRQSIDNIEREGKKVFLIDSNYMHEGRSKTQKLN